jgi:DNA-binding NarL/FixJ family response regulator
MNEAASHASSSAPLIAIAVEDSTLASEILRRFPAEERSRLQVLDDPARLLDHPTERKADAVVVSFQVMRQLAKHQMEAVSEFCNANDVVLLIRSQEFLDSVGFLEFAGGVVFLDATMDRLPEILALSHAGYSILPSAAVMDIVTDRLRCDSIARLNLLELSILDQVRLAKTNRAIARSLGLSEANVKTKVRAILKALKFQNRTEAAVFAARQDEMIRNLIAGRDHEQNETDDHEEEAKRLPH